jgi:Bax protein
MVILTRIIFIVSILLIFIEKLPAQHPTRSYIEKYQDLAVNLMRESCIPASVIIGVAIIESASGKSRNCKFLKNHFGIKLPKGQVSRIGSKLSSYRRYASDTASYMHFCKLITSKKFYDQIKYDSVYTHWVYFMNRYNYAGEKGVWRNKIVNTIKKYELHKLDVMN